MYDLDAPYPSPKNNKSPFCHTLITSIPGMNVSKGNMILAYIPPSPPSDSPPHRYYIEIYDQIFIIDSKIKINRDQFNVQDFARQYGLTLFDKINFRVVYKLTTAPSSLISFSSNGSLPMLPMLSTTGIKSPMLSPVKSPRFKSSHKRASTKNIQYFKTGNDLTEEQQKYCKCVLHVASEQPGKCNLEKAWFEERDHRICYNPYAVCAHTTGTTYRWCAENLNFDNIPDDELEAWLNLHKIESSQPYNRTIALEKIAKWKLEKGK
jgi:hypothetical protein